MEQTGLVPDPDRSIRVMYVDDDPALGEVVADYLERIDDGITVVTETSAAAGLARLADEPINCVVSDHRMPGTNGIEFCRDLREDYPTIPFILVTGLVNETVVSDATAADVSGYIQKGNGTNTFEDLHARIRKAVSRTRAAPRENRP